MIHIQKIRIIQQQLLSFHFSIFFFCFFFSFSILAFVVSRFIWDSGAEIKEFIADYILNNATT